MPNPSKTPMALTKTRMQANRQHLKTPPPGQPQTNGGAEKAAQDVTTQTRKYKIAVETRLGKTMHARYVVFKSLARPAADAMSRCSVGRDGKVHLQRFCANLSSQETSHPARMYGPRPLNDAITANDRCRSVVLRESGLDYCGQTGEHSCDRAWPRCQGQDSQSPL